MPPRADPAPFDVDMGVRGDELWVCPAGDLDLAAAPELEESLSLALRSDAERIVIDLGGLEFIDSTGIAAIVKACSGPERGRVALVPGNERVQGVFRLTHLVDALPFRSA